MPTRVLSLRALIATFVAVAMAIITPLSEPAESGELRDQATDASVTAGGSGWSFRRVEECLMRKTNRRRANHGRRKLGWDKQLGYVARGHARYMANNQVVVHDSRIGSKVTRWRRIGQNTGRSRGCRKLFRAFWRSSGHRSNLLGTWRYMGVGAIRNGGRLYAQHIFESRRDPGNIYHRP